MAALALTFAACSNDDADLLIPDQPLNTDGIPFKATISTGTSGTRGLTPDGDDLKATWEIGEKVALIHNGVNDEMEVKSVDGDGVATIVGTITGNPSTGDAVTVIYPSTAADGTTGNVKANLLYAQTNGTLADVAAKYDVRKGTGTLKVNGTASLNGNVSLDNQNAIFKFTIKNAAGSATIDIKALAATIGTTTYVTTPTAATSELYFVLPAVTSQKVSFAAVGDAKIYAFSKTVSFDAGRYYQSTLKMSETNVVPGKFTVNSGGNKVQFAKGNLRYVSGVWGFFDTQDGCYDTYSANAWDKFGWVGQSGNLKNSTPEKWGVTTSETTAAYGTDLSDVLASDWKNVPGIGSGWSTLSHAEWGYLFNTREVNGGTGAGHSYTLGQSVNDKLGVVIYPDNYTGTLYTTGANWSTFEAAGCVFLPAAGSRSGSSVTQFSSLGYYWSSTSTGIYNAYFVYFNNTSLYTNNVERSNGHSVRLVRQVE